MNNIYLTLVAILILRSNPVSSQIKDYVTSNTVEIKSADIHDTVFNDLLPLQEAIGDKRVVMLGEVYHGDGETFKLKSRVVRFLHERMGFNVLAFESDFFALNDGYELVKSGQISYDSLIYLSVFPIWTRCAQVRNLFSYLKESAGMVISGIDNRAGSAYSYRYLGQRVDSFLKQTGIPFVRTQSYPSFISAINRAWATKNKATVDSLSALLTIVIEELNAKQSSEFYVHVLRGLLDNYKMMLHYWLTDEYKVSKKDYPHHDLGMAENLKWLAARKFPNEKIIVWAHNTHVEKRVGELPYAKYKSMGQFFIEDSSLAEQTYILGTTCFGGTGKITGRTIEKAAKPQKNSIESWMHAKHCQYAFVDFGNVVNKKNVKPFYMKSYLTSAYRQNWTQLYDGILYVREAKPCTVQNFIQ